MFGARPIFFVGRPDGTRTALVEVDQLPASIKIAGVPANLPTADADDMICVGNMERASLQYIIEIAAANHPSANTTSAGKKSPQLSGNGEDGEHRNRLGKKKAQNNELYRSEAAPIPSRTLTPVLAPVAVPAPVVVSAPVVAPAPVVIPPPALVPALASESAPAPAPAHAPVASPAAKNTRPRIVPGTKQFCTFWIRTGGCDFMQQGCVYSHVMPDEETLKAIGFPDGHPKWYRDATKRASKAASRLAAKPRGRINRSKPREATDLPLRSKTHRNPAPPPRRIETVPTAEVPIAEPTSSNSPSILDIFSAPLSWQSNDMPALEPLKINGGPSKPTPKYVEIRVPDPKHRYLFVGDGKEKSG